MGILETPTPRRRSRWDETPNPLASGASSVASMLTPTGPSSAAAGGLTPTGSFPAMATPLANYGSLETPHGNLANLATPTPKQIAQAEASQWFRSLREHDERNRPLSDEELDEMFPAEGYAILKPPANYKPMHPPVRFNFTPTPSTPGFVLQEDDPVVAQQASQQLLLEQPPGNLPPMKPEDRPFFEKLLTPIDEESLTIDAAKERKIMKLLLKIKNGTPPMRKQALRQITDKAREFGPDALFDQILTLLMSPTLEDQERHLLVKVIDRILYKLDELVRPHVHKILVVIEPLLIEEDYYARVEGREIISNLSKAAGLANMISTMRPDIDNPDEYVRNTTARAFSVVASALGIPALLPFLQAV